MKRIAGIFFLSAGIFLTGCAGMKVNTDWDKTANFAALKTYTWAPGPQAATGDPRLDNSLFDSRVKTAVDRSLADKGYQKIKEGTPNFWVAYNAAIREKTDTKTFKVPYSNPMPVTSRGFRGAPQDWSHVGPDTFKTQYEEGTLLVDIANPSTKKLIWRGSISAVVTPNLDSDEREQRVNKAVKLVLDKFPPKPGKK